MSGPPRFAGSRAKSQAGGGLLYGWLLVALFIEYARPANQFTFLDFPLFYSIVPLSLLAASILSQNLRSMADISSDGLAKWVYIMIGLLGVSVAVSPVTSVAQNAFTMVLGYVFLFVLIARIVTTETRLRGVIVTLALSHLYLLRMNPAILSDPEQRHYIVGATFLGDGNDFSLSLCLLIPCVVECAMSARRFLWRWLAWASVPFMIAAIVSTQSRGGTLGLAAVLIYFWWRAPGKVLATAAVAAVGVLVLAFAPPTYFERMRTITASTRDGSAQGRIDAWKGAIGMGVKNPVLGIGARHFGLRWGATAHSTYMLAFAELGLPGLVCVIMLVFGNLRANMKLRGQLLARAGPTPSDDVRRIARMLDLLNAGMVGFAVAGAFLSAAYYPHMYVLTALMISARSIASRQAGLVPTRQA